MVRCGLVWMLVDTGECGVVGMILRSRLGWVRT